MRMLNPSFSNSFSFITLLALVLAWQWAAAQPLTPVESLEEHLVHHSLKVLVDPVAQRISVEDKNTHPEQ